MKLRTFAERVGVRYETAWRWFKADKIKGRQLEMGTVILTEDVGQPPQPDPVVAVYLIRVNSIASLTIIVPIIGFRLSLPLKIFIHITFAETPIASNAIPS